MQAITLIIALTISCAGAARTYNQNIVAQSDNATSNVEKPWKKKYKPIASDQLPSQIINGTLMEEELVEHAFVKGVNHLILTNLRVLKVDGNSLDKRKTEYLSVLWPAVDSWDIATVGAGFDDDVDLHLHTKVGLGTFEWKFKKDYDIFGLQSYLAERIMSARETAVFAKYHSDFWSHMPVHIGPIWELTTQEITAQNTLQTTLTDGETVHYAFKTWRDTYVLTSKRFISIDKRGMTGKKEVIKSVPYDVDMACMKMIAGWSIETAGTLDFDSELKIHLYNRQTFEAEFGRGKGKMSWERLSELQSKIAEAVIGSKPKHMD